MHVIRVLYEGGKRTEFPGELIVTKDTAVFRPMGNSYGPGYILIHQPEVRIAGQEDDDAISVSGLVAWVGSQPGDTLYRRVIMEGFYPIPRP